MRITPTEKTIILNAVREHDPQARVWLFGSRADDRKRGGDIDIAVLSAGIKLMDKLRIRRAITDQLGEQKIDIMVSATGQDPFFRHATSHGVILDD
jgi:uncharacterized protein